jgi:phosphoglycerate dehydrogenase-like enzyme
MRLGIVGLGRIGREVATRAAALGMEVAFYDARAGVAGGAWRRVASLADLLREADVVTIHTDLNETSRHLIGAEQLSQMKPSAYLINTARGGVVDQAALCEALRGGRIAGAALDVLEREPPDPGDPILQLPNVYLCHTSVRRRGRRGRR